MSFTKCILALLLLVSTTTIAQQKNEKTKITLEKLTDNMYLLKGRGGNVGLNFGPESTLMIDDQYANLTDDIVAAIHTVSKNPIQYVFNTHHHGDHTGGNINMEKNGATIVAHQNVRKRLSEIEKNSEQLGLPVITFSKDVTFEFNGEPVLFFHVDNAHTDGDAVVYFTQSNVIHTGDVLFNGRYPYIDLKSGGSVTGYIAALKNIFSLTDQDTKIIPGHGDLANQKDLKQSMEMLESIYSQVTSELKKGATTEQILANKSITAKYDELGFGDGFISTEKMLQTVITELTEKK